MLSRIVNFFSACATGGTILFKNLSHLFKNAFYLTDYYYF